MNLEEKDGAWRPGDESLVKEQVHVSHILGSNSLLLKFWGVFSIDCHTLSLSVESVNILGH